ncbi:hypothetical protein [Halostagnicola kamekurae]|uniref:Uncharacterized protein n=1 Tax=Halostagnicola kamekurae TaxID=619731 RepID=A0A1I6SQQ7_9EURY|nr:hypothetical protein [Halostagnicola kamekurae]SFS79271.1 hypothetical protein SAMN04488556_2849 [Halostagnicola kamekurae]
MGRDEPRETTDTEQLPRVRATIDHGHAVPRFRLDGSAEEDAWLSVRCDAVVPLRQWD